MLKLNVVEKVTIPSIEQKKIRRSSQSRRFIRRNNRLLKEEIRATFWKRGTEKSKNSRPEEGRESKQGGREGGICGRNS